LKLLIFSDIHNDCKALEKLVAIDADYYFAAGDMATWSKGLDRCAQILSARAGRVYVLPGNHESEGMVAAACAKFGLHDFHVQALEIAGYHVAGLGYSNPTPFHTPGEYSEAELAERLENFANLSPLILICHCPPRGTALDRVREGVHAGSTAMLDFIQRHQPAYFFCGHIHEAEGVTVELGKTKATNVGKRGYLLELPAKSLKATSSSAPTPP
jgi:hypothetical protein